ncbi:MAG: leucine-rich repeat protein, partial [Clostridia bacterium]|nr:leucine-rich repeat protein [Clostridia bacterium]
RESVKSIVVGEGITEVGERAFYWSTNCTSVTLPSTLIAVREYGFNNLRALEYITLPNNLKTIEFCAFSECVALKTITLPDSVTIVESNAFSNCYALKSAYLSNGMKTVPSSMFGGDTQLQTVVLPEGVTYIDDTAFINCGLRSITIPSTVTGLGTAVFSGCSSMTAFYVEEGNTAFKAMSGVLFSADGTTLICYPSGKYGQYTIPNGTQRIAYGAFRSARITGLSIPGTLTTIEGYAFSYCNILTSISFPATLTRIGDSAFRGCSALSSVTFHNDSVVLESAVFADCDALVGITLPAKLREIPSSLFYDCAKLSSITIPSTVTKIGSSAFIECDRLVSVTIPGNVKSLGQQAFDYCSRLETIILEEGVQSLGWIAIRNAPALKKVVIPASMTSIDRENFEACPNAVLYVYCGTAGYRYAVSNGLKYVAEHRYTATVTPPTCTAQGYTTHTCACGESYVDSYVPAKEHSYENGICTACGESDPNFAEPLSLRYDDHYDVTGKTVEIIDAGESDNAVLALDGETLIATGIGSAKVRMDDLLYSVTVERAKLHLVMIMGQSNAGNHFANATSDVTCPPGTAYWWGNGQGMNATEPVAYTQPSMGFHTPLLAELYAQSVAAGDPVKNVMIWHEGITSKNGQSIVKWAASAEDTSGTDAAVTMLKNCLSYYEANSDKYEIVNCGVYWLQGESDTGMAAEKYTQCFMAMWNDLKAVGMEYLAFLRVRRGVGENGLDHMDLSYSGSLSAQIAMVNNNPDMFMATTLTENWVGTEATEHTVDIRNYITMMEVYGKESIHNDSYGNAATYEDGFLTTTMKSLYGSNNKCHYGKFGYSLIGADAAYN